MHKKHIYALITVIFGCVVCMRAVRIDKEDTKDFAETVAQAFVDTTKPGFDVEAKRSTVVSLVEKAVEFFEKNKLVDACQAFAQTNKFIIGDVGVSVMNMQGNALVYTDKNFLWSNFANMKDAFGIPIAQEIIKKAKAGGGWVAYEWRNSTKLSYVKLARNAGNEYAIESGYYPHSKEDKVITLVKGAVAVINQDIKEGRPVEQAFSTISYRMGRFVVGDLYLFAVRFDGVLFAQGEEPHFIGTNVLEREDTHGKKINKEIIERLKNAAPGEGVWIEYVSKRAPKKAYAEKVVDAQGNEYFVAAGSYPDADRKQAVDLVRRGYQYLKSHGLSQSAKEFSAPDTDFVYGDLFLFVYDMNGKIIVPAILAGQDVSIKKDEDGRPIFPALVDIANNGGGWVDFKMNKSFQAVYVEKADLGLETVLIGTSLYPGTKRDTALLLAKSGISYLESHTIEQAADAFSNEKGSFIRGELSVFVFDLLGNCYVFGDRMDLAWKNMLNEKDDDNKPYIKLMINAARGGPSQVTYRMNGRPVIAYVETVEKNGTTYVVGSEFYQ